MFEPKVVAIAASIGFVLSFLIGLVSGAPFAMILLRALFLACFTAGMALLLRFLVIRFLPELLSSESQDQRAPAQENGNVVDITIGGQDGNLFAEKEEDLNDMVPDFLVPETAAVEEFDPVPKESEEFVPMYTASSLQKSGAAKQGTKALDGVSTGLGAHSGADSGSHTEAESPASMKSTSGGLDVLPDIQDFMPPERPEGIAGDEDDTEMVSGGFKDAGESSGGNSLFREKDIKTSGIESETMAKAIRTILSREG